MARNDHRTASDFTRLSPTVFHILLSLGAGERHGYAIKREIAARTEGKLKLSPGVLYGSIHKIAGVAAAKLSWETRSGLFCFGGRGIFKVRGNGCPSSQLRL